jgi:iron(III) transport system ATP-binding protein
MIPTLLVQNLRHAYGSLEVLHGVDLQVPSGTMTAVLGPSGCGKSTLLRLIAGFERPGAGRIVIAGTTVVGEDHWVPPQHRRIGYVAQEGALFPHLTVRRNLEFGLDRSRRSRAALVELMDLVSLEPSHLDRYPHELSGGQQQRVALARTLARRPALVLLDEPFSALDTDLRAATRTSVAEALQASEVTTVLVTHDQDEALSFADTVAVMVAGRFTQVANSREVYEHPADLATARLVGPTVVVPGRVRGRSAATTLGEVPLRAAAADGEALILLRPEQIGVRRHAAGSGVVSRSEYFGRDRVVELAWPGLPTPVRARVASDVAITVGDRVDAVVSGTGLAFRRASGWPEAPGERAELTPIGRPSSST